MEKNYTNRYLELLRRFIKSSNCKRPNVLVLGYTGAGKTSLIQGIFGKAIVPDDRISAGMPKTPFFDCYENKNIKIYDSKGLEPGEKESIFLAGVKDFMRSIQEDRCIDNHIHLVWYLIQGVGARVTPCDLRLIKGISLENTIVVISKVDCTPENAVDALKYEISKSGIKMDRIVTCSDSDPKTLIGLENLTYEMLPSGYKSAWSSAQIVNFERKTNIAIDAMKLISGR